MRPSEPSAAPTLGETIGFARPTPGFAPPRAWRKRAVAIVDPVAGVPDVDIRLASARASACRTRTTRYRAATSLPHSRARSQNQTRLVRDHRRAARAHRQAPRCGQPRGPACRRARHAGQPRDLARRRGCAPALSSPRPSIAPTAAPAGAQVDQSSDGGPRATQGAVRTSAAGAAPYRAPGLTLQQPGRAHSVVRPGSQRKVSTRGAAAADAPPVCSGSQPTRAQQGRARPGG